MSRKSNRMDALHKVARSQDVRPGFQLLDEIVELELKVKALEWIVREFLAEDVDGRESCRLNRDGTPRKDCKCIVCRAVSILASDTVRKTTQDFLQDDKALAMQLLKELLLSEKKQRYVSDDTWLEIESLLARYHKE